MNAFCIEICVGPQGITVASSPEMPENSEAGTPVGSIDEALQRAREIFDAQGENPDAGNAQAEQDFTSGFA